MNRAYVVATVLLLSGCNTLRTMTGSHNTPGPSPLPDDYTVSGVTSIDYQVIQPIRVLDSTIAIEVMTPSDTAYHVLNKYEYKTDPNGAGGGGISFGRVEIPSYSSNGSLIGLTITPEPVAPKGTAYRIRSIATTVSKSLY